MIKYYIIYPIFFILLMMFSFKVFATEIEKKADLFSGDMWQSFCAKYSKIGQDSVAYQAGVDAYGRPVVGANIGDVAVETPIVPAVIQLDLDVNLMEYLGISMPKGILGEAKIGHVRIENGQVYFNDKQVAVTEHGALPDVCKRINQNKTEIEDKASYTDLEILKNNGAENDSTTSKAEE